MHALIKFCLNSLAAIIFNLLLISMVKASAYEIKPMALLYGSHGKKKSSNTQTLTITNKDNHTLYLALSLQKVMCAGYKNQTTQTQLQANPEEFGLVINNDKLIIPPHQQRSVTVFSLNKPETLKADIIYNIITTPMESSKFVSPKDNYVHGGVNFVLKYLVNVLVTPDDKKNEMQFKQIKNTVKLKNVGNTFNAVSIVYACPVDVQSSQVTFHYQNEHYHDIINLLHCEKLPGAEFIYAGNTATYIIPEEKNLMLVLYDNGRHTVKSFTNTVSKNKHG